MDFLYYILEKEWITKPFLDKNFVFTKISDGKCRGAYFKFILIQLELDSLEGKSW